MKKIAALMFVSTLLGGCAAQNGPQQVNAQDLINHHFVLHSVNGTPLSLENNATPPTLSFSEGLHIAGSMCNRFSGQAHLSAGTLSAPHLAMTRMLCSDAQLNSLDNQLGQMLATGAKLSLVNQQLTLTTPQQSLTYQLTTTP